MIRPTTKATVLLALLPLALAARPALAQDDTERARELFREGVERMDQRSWSEAASRFREALSLHDAASIRFNLAFCLNELEDYGEAAEQVDRVLAASDASDDIRRQAESLGHSLERRVGRLVVRLERGGGVTVHVDTRELAADRVGTAVPVTAGDHVVTASRGGREVGREEVSVPARETVEVNLELSAVDPAEAAATADIENETPPGLTGDEDEDTGGGSVFGDWRLWVGVGGGVVLITAIVLAVALSGGTQSPVKGSFMPRTLEFR